MWCLLSSHNQWTHVYTIVRVVSSQFSQSMDTCLHNSSCGVFSVLTINGHMFATIVFVVSSQFSQSMDTCLHNSSCGVFSVLTINGHMFATIVRVVPSQFSQSMDTCLHNSSCGVFSVLTINGHMVTQKFLWCLLSSHNLWTHVYTIVRMVSSQFSQSMDTCLHNSSCGVFSVLTINGHMFTQ